MALTNCPDCSHQISDQAHACPKCGHPITSAKNVYVTNVRKGKGKKLIGGILIIVALLMAAGSAGKSTSSGTSAFGGLMLFVGIILLIYGKIEHWWHWK